MAAMRIENVVCEESEPCLGCGLPTVYALCGTSGPCDFTLFVCGDCLRNLADRRTTLVAIVSPPAEAMPEEGKGDA